MKRIFLVVALLALLGTSCTGNSNAGQPSISLASFTENDVKVSISLDRGSEDSMFLRATFTPPDGYHLYSKDIPYNGLDGLGRPTRLELLSESQIRVLGDLTASADPQVPDFEPRELLVYPSGPVTLSLQIQLPPGKNWFDDSVSVTYMACSDLLCRPPVEGKVIPIHVPGADAFNEQ